MDRITFLNQLWGRFLRPLLLLVALIIGFRFLVFAFTENGSERGFLLLIAIGALVILILNILSSISTNVRLKFYNTLSEKVKARVKQMNQLLKVFSFVTGIVLCYIAWQKDWIGVLIMAVVLILQAIIDARSTNRLV